MSEIHFRSHFWPFQIDMQLKFFLKFFSKMAAGGHFGCPKFTFDRNSGHFKLINFFFFGGRFGCLKITLDRISGHFRLIGHFGCPKFTFDGISGHFRSIRNFFFLNFFDKMTAGGHFGWDDNVNYRTRPRYFDE